MNRCRWALVLALFIAPALGANPPQQDKAAALPPPWAYGFDAAIDPATYVPPPPAAAPAAAPAPDDGVLKHLPGSELGFTLTQIRDGFGPADWYPTDHPKMPDIVAHGRKPEVRACSLCHYPNGKRSADPRKANTNIMIGFAKSMTDDEIKAASEYFSSMKWTPWVKVVETNSVPKTRIAGGMFLRLEGEVMEPLGGRIVETPENVEATEALRNSRSGFIAYVPVGSLKKGEDLVVKGGAGKTVACAACHGEGLKGNGAFPSLAGRSPSYIARQLYDIQHYTRNGPGTQLMRPIVEKLNGDDIVAITAYLASLAP